MAGMNQISYSADPGIRKVQQKGWPLSLLHLNGVGHQLVIQRPLCFSPIHICPRQQPPKKRGRNG